MEIILDIIQTLDYELLLMISNRWRGGMSDTFWTIVTSLGNAGALWIVLGIVLLFFRKTRRAGIAMLIALTFALVVGNLCIKQIVMRPRPFVTYKNLIALVDPGDQWSFPSGHTLSSFAAATALWFFHRKTGFLALIVAALIGLSRLYACVHYPTDVLAGMLIGIVCGLVAAWLADRLCDRVHTLRLRKGAS